MTPATRRLRRWASVASLGGALALLGLSFTGWPGLAQERASRRELIASVERDGHTEPVAVLLPAGVHAPGTLSVIVALHGRGEALRGPQRGVLGWLDDYALERAFGAMSSGRVSPQDAGGMASEAQLRALAQQLRRRAFRDVAVVMPYTPDLAAELPGSPAIAAYGAWLVDVMLPAVRSALPALSDRPDQTALDGVSLGGMLALDIGLRRPDVFGSVGGIQPAVRGRLDAYGPLATQRTRCLRLASSEADPFLRATRALSAAWRSRRIRHEIVEYAGPHGYAFNRGPGSLELLRFHHACFGRSR